MIGQFGNQLIWVFWWYVIILIDHHEFIDEFSGNKHDDAHKLLWITYEAYSLKNDLNERELLITIIFCLV